MKKLNASGICFLALAAVLNIVGANIALALRLPVYLDSIGTMLGAALLGPVYGMLPGLVSALLNGFTTDPYAFYYLPVQLVTGLMTGLAFRLFRPTKIRDIWRLLPASLLISLPGTVVSSVITALLFGGITSSGSTVLVQLLHGAGLHLTLSVCLVQAVTDFLDRILSLALTAGLAAALPSALRAKIQNLRPGSPAGKGADHGTL